MRKPLIPSRFRGLGTRLVWTTTDNAPYGTQYWCQIVHVSEQLKEVTSDILNGVQTTKKMKLEGENAIVCTLPPAANGGVPASLVLPLPQMNFTGASNFNISINYDK